MQINKEYTFKTVNKDGLEVICDTLAVVSVENESPIIIYTDYTLDNVGKFNLYVSKVIQNGEDFTLEPIDNYISIPEVHSAMQKVMEEINI